MNEVTRKRGLASPRAHSALPITRRRRDQLSLVDQSKSRNTRAGWPAFACERSRAGDAPLPPRVARQTEHVIDLVGLAPGHQGLAREAGIGAQHDLHLRPAVLDLSRDAIHLLDCPGASVDVGTPELGGDEMPAAEHIEQQIAVAVVVAVKEAAFLIAVQRIVGGVEVEHDPARRFLMRVEKQVDKQLLDRRSIVADPVIARRLARPRRMLQTVQRALARQEPRRLAGAIELAEEDSQNRIAAKFVVVVKVLVAERQAEDPLGDESLQRVNGEKLAAAVGKASREPIRQSDRLVRLAQQQRPSVEPSRHRNPPQPAARRPFQTPSPSGYTVPASGSSFKSPNSLIAKQV